MTGKLSVVVVREYMIECGTPKCVGGGYITAEDAQDKHTAERLFREDGWAKRAKIGWTCPSCVEGNAPMKDDGLL